jgi:hypothetical protein
MKPKQLEQPKELTKMAEKDITPTNPDETVNPDEDQDQPAERKTLKANMSRKTLSHGAHAW